MIGNDMTEPEAKRMTLEERSDEALEDTTLRSVSWKKRHILAHLRAAAAQAVRKYQFGEGKEIAQEMYRKGATEERNEILTAIKKQCFAEKSGEVQAALDELYHIIRTRSEQAGEGKEHQP